MAITASAARNAVVLALATAGLISLGSAALAGASSDFESAASTCEDFIELVASGDAPAATAMAGDMRKAFAAISKRLPEAGRADLAARLAAIEAANGRGDGEAASLEAVEAFRTIIVAANDKKPPVPLDVSLLDYSGFKLSILASAKATNWPAVEASAQEAHGFWQRLSSRIKNKGTADLMATIDKGLQRAVADHDGPGLAFAAKLTLDAVDVLEQQFAAK
jgi:hypothetical protein